MFVIYLFFASCSENVPELRAEPVSEPCRASCGPCLRAEGPRVSPGPSGDTAHSLLQRRSACERSVTSCCFEADFVASVCFRFRLLLPPGSPEIQTRRWTFRLLMLKQSPRTTWEPHLSAHSSSTFFPGTMPTR